MPSRSDDGNSASPRRAATRDAAEAPPEAARRARPPAGGLEIGQDERFQSRMHTIQRVGWIAMAAVLLLALLGLFGNGPLSATFAVEPGSPVWLEYQRIGRYQGPMTLRLHLAPGAGREGRVRVWLDNDYLEGVELERIVPEPDRVEAGPGRTIYTFGLTRTDRHAAVTFHLKPAQAGTLHGRIGLDAATASGGAAVRFRQWIYP